MRERFQLKGIVAVCNVMALAIHPAHKVKEDVKQPMKYEEHLDLLPEVYLLMAHELRLIVGLPCDPDEHEEGEPGVIIKYLFPGIDLIR